MIDFIIVLILDVLEENFHNLSALNRSFLVHKPCYFIFE